jgi:ABC-type multidrug transport system fused ATPase/permease subunit
MAARAALAAMEIAPSRLVPIVGLTFFASLLKVAAISLCWPLFHRLLSSGEAVAVVIQLALLVLALAWLGGLCGWVAARSTARLAVAAEITLGEKLLRRHLRFSQAYFDATPQGVTLAHLQGLPRRVGRLVPWAVQASEALLTLALLAALMVVLSPLLAAGSLVALAIYYFLVKRVVDRAERQAQEEESLEEQSLIEIQDLVANLPLLRLFASEPRALGDFRTRAAERGEANLRSRAQLAGVEEAREGLNTLVVLGFAVAAAWAVAGSEPSALSRHLVFFFVFRRAMSPFAALQRLPRRGRFLDEQFAALEEVLHASTRLLLVEGGRPFPGLRRGIEVRDLEFGYDERAPVLSGVSCAALRGRYTTLVGRTGSGKSTLLRLWMRLYDPPPGTILFDGIDLRDFDAEGLRARIAFADAHPHFFNAPLRDNLTYGGGELAESRLLEVLETVGLAELVTRLPRGLDEVLGDRGIRLSSGERQRVGLARALLRDADLVLWDEATSALDAVAEKQVLSVAEGLAASKTVVTVTHRLSTLSEAAWVVVLERGRVVEEGYRDDLLASSGALSELMNAAAMERGEVHDAGR